MSYLVAVWTVSSFGVSQRPVRLPVPGQVTGRAVTFTTIRTLTFFVRRLFRRRLLRYPVIVIAAVEFFLIKRQQFNIVSIRRFNV